MNMLICGYKNIDNIDNPLFVTAFTTILLTESASEPILTISLLGLFIPTTTNITLLSNYI